ncbi:MAG: amidohydrolase [Clostridia bacterium]|nr:amidohydrolase [Clostridia bacterium]
MVKQFNDAIEKYKEMILNAERFIWEHPETGYKEYETSKYMEKIFTELGYTLVLAENIPGFYTVLDTNRPGPEVLVLAELDSVICPEHKAANPDTGAVHSCGHNAQCAALLGIAAALKEPGVIDRLCGRIRLCAVPAEELIELEFRTELKKQGKIKYFSGKSEFLSRGYFDGVDIAVVVHTNDGYKVGKGFVGSIVKRIIYKGISAHAGGAPWDGKNALYAANCGINAINAIRETFKESDIIRVHPIITNGGAMVSAIPEKVVLESYVRGISLDAMCEANQKVNQALCGAAVSIGTNIEICDTIGFSPLVNDKNLIDVVERAMALSLPEYKISKNDSMSSISTDLGDLSCIMPAIHPYAGGATGNFHGKDFEITNPVAACVDSAKLQLAMLYLLLSDGAKEAKRIVGEYKSAFASKEEYFSFVDSIGLEGERIEYLDGNVIKVNVM